MIVRPLVASPQRGGYLPVGGIPRVEQPKVVAAFAQASSETARPAVPPSLGEEADVEELEEGPKGMRIPWRVVRATFAEAGV